MACGGRNVARKCPKVGNTPFLRGGRPFREARRYENPVHSNVPGSPVRRYPCRGARGRQTTSARKTEFGSIKKSGTTRVPLFCVFCIFIRRCGIGARQPADRQSADRFCAFSVFYLAHLCRMSICAPRPPYFQATSALPSSAYWMAVLCNSSASTAAKYSAKLENRNLACSFTA